MSMMLPGKGRVGRMGQMCKQRLSIICGWPRLWWEEVQKCWEPKAQARTPYSYINLSWDIILQIQKSGTAVQWVRIYISQAASVIHVPIKV